MGRTVTLAWNEGNLEWGGKGGKGRKGGVEGEGGSRRGRRRRGGKGCDKLDENLNRI